MNRTRVVLVCDNIPVAEAVLVDHEQAVVYTRGKLPVGEITAEYGGEVYPGQLWREGNIAVFVLQTAAPGPFEWVSPSDPGPDGAAAADALQKLIATWRERADDPAECPDDPGRIDTIVEWICRVVRRCR